MPSLTEQLRLLLREIERNNLRLDRICLHPEDFMVLRMQVERTTLAASGGDLTLFNIRIVPDVNVPLGQVVVIPIASVPRINIVTNVNVPKDTVYIVGGNQAVAVKASSPVPRKPTFWEKLRRPV